MAIILLLFLLSPTGELEDVKAFPGFEKMQDCKQRAKEAEAYYAERGLIVKGKCVNNI